MLIYKELSGLGGCAMFVFDAAGVRIAGVRGPARGACRVFLFRGVQETGCDVLARDRNLSLPESVICG